MATLPYPPRAAYNSMAFQDPNGPYSEAQQNAADAYGDIVKARLYNDRLSGRSQSEPFTAMMGNTSTGPLSNTYYSASADALTNVANRPFSADANNFADSNITRARNELLNRSNEGEFAAPGYGDVGQFAGSFDPANVPMGNNRLSPVDQYKAIAYDTAIMEGTAPVMPRDKNATIANLAADSDAGRYGVAGIGDLGQFAGSFDPANVPMGSNRLSPVDQYNLIKEDAGLLSGDVTLANYSRPLPFGTTEAVNNNSVSPQVLKDLQNAAAANLGGDSDVGRFAVPGYGDQGQFFGGDGSGGIGDLGGGGSNGKYYDDMSASAYAEGGDVQMPQEAGANPFADPNTMAVYDQMRQTVSPKEFGDEMLAGASQVDPQEVAKFKAELDQLDVPMEVLDMLNNMVDEILANPDNYEQVKQKYAAMGVTEDLLPAQFDPHFFSALNMAVDQMVGEPAGAQAFARGGIAELTPISKAIADYGRNGDTMLAHITPAEARMLRRRGGAGTTNPNTGLKEYFSLGKLFKGIGNAIKSFASSTVGRIVTTVALGFFLGPAAAAFMGVGAGTAAGLAISGFVGGAGSTLLAGGNLKDALKAGAIGGLTAGAVAGFSGAPLTGGTNLTAGQAFSGQVDKFTNAITPSATASGIQAPTIDAGGQTRGLAPTDVTQAPYKPLEMTGTPSKPFDSYFGSQPSPQPTGFNPEFPVGDPGGGFEPYNKTFADAQARVRAPVNFVETPVGANEQVYRAPSSGMADVTTNTARDLTRPAISDPLTSFTDKIKSGYNDYFSPSNIQAQGLPEAERAGAAARDAMLARTPNATPAMLEAEYLRASKAAMPGIVSTYGPLAAAGIGALAIGGGFKPTAVPSSAMRDQLMKPVTQRIAEGGNQRNYYVQNLPGVKYDQYGAPIFGQYNPMPMYDTGLGIASLAGPRGYAAGGEVTAANFDEQAYLIANPDVAAELKTGKSVSGQPVLFTSAYDHYVKYGKAEGRAAFNKTETAAAAAVTDTATKAKQATALGTVAAAKATKKAIGSKSAYENINAGLAFDAPEGAAAAARATRQAAFAPTLNKFIKADATNTATLGKAYAPTVVGQPYNNSALYSNVYNPVATAVNYNTTPVVAPQGVYTPPVFAPYVPPFVAPFVTPPVVTPSVVDPAITKMLADRAAFQAQSRDVQNKQIKDFIIANNATANDQFYAKNMDYFGIAPSQYAEVVGMQKLPGGSAQSIESRYTQAAAANAGDAAAIAAQTKANAVTDQSIRDYFAKNAGLSDMAAAKYMDANQIDPAQLSRAFAGTAGAVKAEDVFARYQAATANPLTFANQKLLNKGGIATLGTGGYPRRNGQIDGPGTATSDSIPAMLSDGEFVMTAKAVRGAGKGDRRAGAKRMYALMNQLEKNAARG